MSCRTLIKFRGKLDIKEFLKSCLIDCSFVMHEMYSVTNEIFTISDGQH